MKTLIQNPLVAYIISFLGEFFEEQAVAKIIMILGIFGFIAIMVYAFMYGEWHRMRSLSF